MTIRVPGSFSSSRATPSGAATTQTTWIVREPFSRKARPAWTAEPPDRRRLEGRLDARFHRGHRARRLGGEQEADPSHLSPEDGVRCAPIAQSGQRVVGESVVDDLEAHGLAHGLSALRGAEGLLQSLPLEEHRLVEACQQGLVGERIVDRRDALEAALLVDNS